MSEIRKARPSDLETVASWLRSDTDCRLWSGSRVSFPVDLAALPGAIEWEVSASWSVVEGGSLVAFGQLVPKLGERLHLARIITAPERRSEGFGRLLSAHLLGTARSQGPSVVSLNVASDNELALNLYRSLGFVEAERPPDEPVSSSAYMEHAS